MLLNPLRHPTLSAQVPLTGIPSGEVANKFIDSYGEKLNIYPPVTDHFCVEEFYFATVSRPTHANGGTVEFSYSV